MIRRVGVVSITIAASVLALISALPASATPKPSDPLQSGDDRATAHPGNARNCADAELPGTIVLKGDSGPSSLTIDPATIPAGFELTGVVIKGADAYNVYRPAALSNLVAPLKNGKHPEISHWFVCGVKKNGTPTTEPVPTTEPTSPSAPGTSGVAMTTTTTPAPAGGNVDNVDTGASGELASTGASTTIPLLAGTALLLLGAGLLLALRIRARRR